MQARFELELSLTPHSQEPVASYLALTSKALRLQELPGPDSIGVALDGIPLEFEDQVGYECLSCVHLALHVRLG